MTDVTGWALVAQMIEARCVAMGMSKERLYELTMSETTFRKMADGEPVVRAANRSKIALALGWTPDSLDRILAGKQPVEVNPPDDETAPRWLVHRLDQLEQRMTQRIESLESEVREAAGLVTDILGAMAPPAAGSKRVPR